MNNTDKIVILTAPIKAIVPVIKIVGDSCNMRCSYCFYHNRDQVAGEKMALPLLEKFIREYLEIFPGEICFNWHGGEPLLAGINFFEKIIEYELSYADEKHAIHNTVQTNGTLITNQWASFFLRHRFGVGISIDGARETHSRFRKMAGGNEGFTRTIRGIELLREVGIEPAVIQTVTHSSTEIETVRKNLNFLFKELKLKQLGINFFSDTSGQNKDMIGESVSNGDFIRLMKTYFEYWLDSNDSNLRIREIDHFISGIVGKRATTCNWNGSCVSFFCLDVDGTIYPSCDRMSNRSDIAIGDLKEQSLRSILNSKKRIDYAYEANSMSDNCRECKWFHVCHNGCPMHRTKSPAGEYIFCEARKTIFAYIERRLTELTNHTPQPQKENSVYEYHIN